jgi:hypothetical protein
MSAAKTTNDGTASQSTNDVSKHSRERMFRRQFVFLGIFLAVTTNLLRMPSNSTMWNFTDIRNIETTVETNLTSTVSNELSTNNDNKTTETEKKQKKKNYSKILAELLPELDLGIELENIQDKDRRKHFEHLVSVHLSDSPTRTAGRWVEKPPTLAKPASPELLKCLAKERQGICLDAANLTSKDSLQKSRIRLINRGSIYNHPEIMKGYDPYMWESDDEAYATIAPGNGTSELRQTLEGRKFFLIGDSLNRQWAQSMKCVLQSVYGIKNVDVRYCLARDFPRGIPLAHCLGPAKSRDYVIFNFGHHQDPSNPAYLDRWREGYKEVMERALHSLKINLGHLHPSHIIFRTTSVRHYWAGRGEWNTNSSQVGGLEANMDASWGHYGGNHPAQPIQNLLGLSMVAAQSNFSIMDVAPLTLARADSTFDGSHFCMPGPMEEWTRMLFYRILQNKK